MCSRGPIRFSQMRMGQSDFIHKFNTRPSLCAMYNVITPFFLHHAQYLLILNLHFLKIIPLISQLGQRNSSTDNNLTYCPSKNGGGFSFIFVGHVTFPVVLKFIELTFPSSMTHSSTSGLGEPGLGYLIDLEGGKDLDALGGLIPS